MANGGVLFVNLVIYQHKECVGCTPTNGNLEFTVRFPDDVTGTKPYFTKPLHQLFNSIVLYTA